MKNSIVENLKILLSHKKVRDKTTEILNTPLYDNLDCHNLYNCFELQAKLVNLQIMLGSKLIDLEKLNLDDVINNFEKTTVDLIQKEYNPKTKSEFIHILFDNYFINGYMLHGTSKLHFDNIMSNGLNGNNNFKNIDLLNEINNVFISHKRKKCFEGKMNLLSSNCYYLSDHVYSAIYYAYQSPEYFSRFCANGHFMCDNNYDRFAYFRRDKNACYSNLEVFCNNNNFSEAEKSKVLNCFNLLWKENVNNDEHFYLFLVPRKLLNKTLSDNFETFYKELINYSKKDIVSFVLRPRLIHEKTYTPISVKDLLCVPLLNLHKKFKNSNKGKKFININDRKVIFDLYQISPYKKNKFYIFNADSDKIEKNLIFVSKNNESKVLSNNYTVLANELRANTKKGQEIIDKARSKITLDNLKKNLLLKACKDIKKCKILLDENLNLCFKKLYNMLFDYIIMLKSMIDNDDWFSNLDSGSYYTAYGELDQHYLILKAKDSLMYDRDLLLSRIENIENFVYKQK